LLVIVKPARVASVRALGYSRAMPDSPAVLPQSRLLSPADPPPVAVVNPEGRAPAVLICDHASNRVPARLADLGLDAAARARHIAWDIGVAAVGRALAAALDAPLVLPAYSRLVIDLNRDPEDPTAICVISDRTIVPGNRGLAAADRVTRIAEIFAPYHAAVAGRIDAHLARGRMPALVSLHSFTPVIAGWGHERQERPWHIGVLFERDERLAQPLLVALRARGDLVVGENEPYSARNGHGFSLARHGAARGLRHVELEIRQDLIADEAGAVRFSGLLAEALTPLLAAE
jgi:predicted N-formylglutamate amidohydrolase